MPSMSEVLHGSRILAARVSILVGVLLLGVKWTAYLLTGSLAMLSDALESVVHVGATGLMYWCLKLSQTPPDEEHPYGHGRAESLSVGFEGGLVALTGVGVLYQVVASYWRPYELTSLDLGLWLSGVAAAVNLGLGLWLRHMGRTTRSPILVADGAHVLSDVYTSGGALVGLGLVLATGWFWIDAAVAAILACFVLVTGLKLVREAVGGLMDEVDRPLLEQVVAAINEVRTPEWLDAHNLRLRRAGDRVYVDFHLVVPAQWTVAKAHQVSEQIEEVVLRRLGHAGAVFVHLDHPERPEYAALTRTGGTWPLTVEAATRVEEGPESAVID